MRPEPYARGGCHGPDYVGETEFPTILVPDVHGSDSIAMSHPAAFRIATVEHPPLWVAFAPMSTHRTRFAGVVFLLQYYPHA